MNLREWVQILPGAGLFSPSLFYLPSRLELNKSSPSTRSFTTWDVKATIIAALDEVGSINTDWVKWVEFEIGLKLVPIFYHLWRFELIFNNAPRFSCWISHQAVFCNDAPRTVLIDLIFEDGKFIFRAESMPDLVINPADLVMREDNMVETITFTNYLIQLI